MTLRLRGLLEEPIQLNKGYSEDLECTKRNRYVLHCDSRAVQVASIFCWNTFPAKYDCSLCAMLRSTNIPRNPDCLCVCIVVFPYSSLKSGSKLLQRFDYFWTRKMLAIC